MALIFHAWTALLEAVLVVVVVVVAAEQLVFSLSLGKADDGRTVDLDDFGWSLQLDREKNGEKQRE